MGKLTEHYFNVLELQVLLSMYSISQLSFSLCTVMKLNIKRFLPMKISFPLALHLHVKPHVLKLTVIKLVVRIIISHTCINLLLGHQV